jgi:GTP cyclohydrolase II
MHSSCLFSETGEQHATSFLTPEGPSGDSGIQSTLEIRTVGGVAIKNLYVPPEQRSMSCDCRAQRIAAQSIIAAAGGIYIGLEGDAQEGRGAGLENKLKAYQRSRELEAVGLHADTAEIYDMLGLEYDTRRYGHVANWLAEHCITRVTLLSGNLQKISALRAAGIKVTSLPLVTGVTANTKDYMETKWRKFRHRGVRGQSIDMVMGKMLAPFVLLPATSAGIMVGAEYVPTLLGNEDRIKPRIINSSRHQISR